MTPTDRAVGFISTAAFQMAGRARAVVRRTKRLQARDVPLLKELRALVAPAPRASHYDRVCEAIYRARRNMDEPVILLFSPDFHSGLVAELRGLVGSLTVRDLERVLGVPVFLDVTQPPDTVVLVHERALVVMGWMPRRL